MSRTELKAFLKKAGARWVRLEATDVDGVTCMKRMTVAAFLGTLDGTPITDTHFSLSIAGEFNPAGGGPWVHGILGDVLLVPDLETLRAVPWEDGVVSVTCNWRAIDGGPVAAAPRTVLADQVDRLATMGLHAKAAVEYEVAVYRETLESAAAKGFRNLVPLFAGQGPNDGLRNARTYELIGSAYDDLAAYGIGVEEIKTEMDGAQIEINLEASDPVTAADAAAKLKLALKELLHRKGLLPCFLARPPDADIGSSSHVHVSLWDEDGTPVFWDGDDNGRANHNQSELMRHAIGGLLETMTPLAPLFCPTLNSGKRLRDNSAAPVAVCWGHENKSVAVRTTARSANSIRLEHRLPGADANPYLALAAVLAGVRHGITERIEPPAPKTFFAWRPIDSDLDLIPHTLREAVAAMDESALAGKLFDPTFVHHFLSTRRLELAKLDEATTDFELTRYFERI